MYSVDLTRQDEADELVQVAAHRGGTFEEPEVDEEQRLPAMIGVAEHRLALLDVDTR